jgi:YqaJ-like viral recombinase domain
MKHVDCEKLSSEWWAARRGIPTDFNRIMNPKTRKLSDSVDGYIVELIAEILDPNYPASQGRPVAVAVQRSADREAEARKFYEMDLDKRYETDQMDQRPKVARAGFCLTDDGRFGSAPNSLISANGTHGCLELICPDLKTQVEWLLAGERLPAECKCQVHGHLIVAGVQWCDFLSYAPPLAPLQARVFWTEFTSDLRAALAQFDARFQEAKRKLGLDGAPGSSRSASPRVISAPKITRTVRPAEKWSSTDIGRKDPASPGR